MTVSEIEQIKNELRQERAKALAIARENIKKAQLELEQIISYYNQLNI